MNVEEERKLILCVRVIHIASVIHLGTTLLILRVLFIFSPSKEEQ
jgi:hypothetical protein